MSPTSPSSRLRRRGRTAEARPAALLVTQNSAHGISETTVTWRYVAIRGKDGLTNPDAGDRDC